MNTSAKSGCGPGAHEETTQPSSGSGTNRAHDPLSYAAKSDEVFSSEAFRSRRRASSSSSSAGNARRNRTAPAAPFHSGGRHVLVHVGGGVGRR